MLTPNQQPLSSGTVFPFLTADRIVGTSSTSTLETPASLSTDQSITQTGSATLTVAGLVTAQSGLTVSSTTTLSALTASRVLTTNTASAVSAPSSISTAQAWAFTSTLTVVDGNFTITGSADATKTIKFEADGQNTGCDLTIAAGAQTADRTATFPVLTGNSILTLSNATLTSGRIPHATTNGILTDDANLTWASSGLGVGGNNDPFSRSPVRSIGITNATGLSGFYVNAPTGQVAEAYWGVNGTRYGGFTVTSTSWNLQALNSAAMTFGTNGTTRTSLSGSTWTYEDAVDLAFNTTTGTKIGTATGQKIGFWNATPVARPSSTGEATGFTAGAGTTVTDQSTFTGNVGSTAYRINDLVKHLKNIGLIAS